MASKNRLEIRDLRGGRNGFDSPMSLPDNQCVEAMNVDFWEGMLGHKRNGASNYGSLAQPTYGTPSGCVSSLCRGVHNYGPELFYVDGNTPALIAYRGSTRPSAWTTIRYGDAISGNPDAVHSVTFNNRTYFTYESSQSRLHFWVNDSAHSDDTFYRVGIPKPSAAPTVVDLGSPPYSGYPHYYKVAWIYKRGTTIENRSECSDVYSMTPTTVFGQRRITRPDLPSGEEITHWELYASIDGDTYNLIATTSIYTTSVDDDASSSYTGDADPTVGANTPPVSWKYIATDGNRLIGGGNWEAYSSQSRVWFTPVLGSSDVGDAERVPTNNYIDVDAYDGDAITGIVGSFMGNVVVFKGRAIWRLVPTGDATGPYQAVCLTKAIGCVAPKSICQGDDENGSPALYFMSRRGPYRLGVSGLQYLGRDVEDIIATMNQRATVVSHAVWHPDKHQVWFWVSLGTDSYPSKILVLDTALVRPTTGGCRGGWSVFDGVIATARCSIAWNGTGLSYGPYVNPVPYVGSSATELLLLKCDQSGVTTDNGTPYQAYVTTKPYALAGLGMNCSVGQSHLSAKSGENVTITQTITRDYGAETRTSTCSLSPSGLETRVQRQFEGSEMAGAGVVQFTLGDEAATSQCWTLEALMVPYQTHEER